MADVALADILHYLADVAPAQAASWDRSVRSSDFTVLDWDRTHVVARAPDRGSLPEGEDAVWRGIDCVTRTDGLDRLAELDELHHAERLLRLGWLFLVGNARRGGAEGRVFLPLASAPVAVTDAGRRRSRLRVLADFEIPAVFRELAKRDEIEEGLEHLLDHVLARPAGGERARMRLPPTWDWVWDLAAAAGFQEPRVLSVATNPMEQRAEEGLVVCPGMAVYLARDIDAPNVAGTLRGWSSQAAPDTALGSVYLGANSSATDTDPPHELVSPLPLNRPQREALGRARREPVVVVSGPPGTGKSHLVAAIAVDQVAAGHSVLIATQSVHATDVIAGMLETLDPGPRFVRFGQIDERLAVADQLSSGLARPYSRGDLERIRRRRDDARRRVDRIRERIIELLERERRAVTGLRDRDLLAAAASQAPGVLDDDLDWEGIDALLAARDRRLPLIGNWWQRRAERKLRSKLRSRSEASWSDVVAAIEAGRAERAVRRGLAEGGLTLEPLWGELSAAEAAWREEEGRVVESRRRSRENSKQTSTRAVAALASALRAGRVQRRRMLRELRGGDFLDVLPLWVGTLQEIDDTMPVEAGAFDVVIFDEASQIDQMRAAPALARARRAVVVGDPRQLRHVSFVGDEAMQDAARARYLPADLARILDVRRNSLFDAATGAAPVTWLDEHFRSLPHIVGFSNERFYGGALRLMTQHPTSESRDAIKVIHTPGAFRVNGHVNRAEVEAVESEVRRAVDQGAGSIGVITPFRMQADSLEAMLLSSFTAAERRRHEMRVGTVHAFQGSEADVVVASIALGADELGGSLRFLQDPNLFNVLVTRARREMVLVTSVTAADLPDGLLAAYLRHAREPPLPSEEAAPPTGWVAELAQGVAGYGLAVVAGYPVAGWSVDLAVGDGARAVGVECGVHPDGPEAHIERHMTLRRAGWQLTDAYQTRWLARPEAAVAALANAVLQ